MKNFMHCPTSFGGVNQHKGLEEECFTFLLALIEENVRLVIVCFELKKKLSNGFNKISYLPFCRSCRSIGISQ
jgi:hypothetical protein